MAKSGSGKSATAPATVTPVRKTAIYNSPEIQQNWTSVIGRQRQKGWWLDSDDSVESKHRLDSDKAPITVDTLAAVSEKLDNLKQLSEDEKLEQRRKLDPQYYLLGEIYVLVLVVDSKTHAIIFDENKDGIIDITDREMDTHNWDPYKAEGLRSFITVFGRDCELKAVMRNPTFKMLADSGVGDMIVRQVGERKHFSVELEQLEATGKSEA